jgi:hypothetical protein
MRGVQTSPGELGIDGAGMTGARLLELPVRVRGIRLGRTVDLLLDPSRPRVLGLDVRCGDERNRFLPLSATIYAETELLVPSALVLVDEEDAGFYRERAVSLASLRGRRVEHEGRQAGRLLDVAVDVDGLVVALVVDADGTRARVPCTTGFQLGGGILRC